MHNGGRARGQSIQIGAVLLFGILVILFSFYQAFVIPAQNQEVEFKHNLQVQDQLQQLRGAIVSMPGKPVAKSVSVTLGAQYPSRTFGINPGPPSGSVRTVKTTDPSINVSIANASASGELSDVWNGTARNYTTGALVYRPDYNEYRNPPVTVYENTVLYNRFDTGMVTLTDQALIDGKRITLVTLNGSLQAASSGTVTVDLKPISISTNTVGISNATASSNVTIRLPTQLSEGQWETLLDGEFTNEGGHVYNISVQPRPGSSRFDTLVIRLEPNVTYQLRLAKVGVGVGTNRSDQRYITDVAGNGSSVPEDGTTELVVEVRDGLNNPLSGVTLNASTNGTGTVSLASNRTDGDGQLTLEYEAPANIDGSPRAAAINASITVDPGAASAFRPNTFQNVTMVVTVLNSDGSGTGGGGGGSNAAYTVDWADPDEANPSGPLSSCTSSDCTWQASSDADGQLSLRATTDPSISGTTFDYGLGDKSLALLSKTTGETNANGNDTVVLTPKDEGTVGVFVSSGGTSARIDVTIRNVVGLLYQFNAAAESNSMEVDGQDRHGGLSLTLRNEYNKQVELRKLTIDPANNSINGLSDRVSDSGVNTPRGTELFVESVSGGSSGYVEYLIEADTYVEIPKDGLTVDLDNPSTPNLLGTFRDPSLDFNGNPTVPSDAETQVSLYEFYSVEPCGGDGDSDGLGNCEADEVSNVDLAGKEFTVTATFTVGGGSPQTEAYTFTVAGTVDGNQAPVADPGGPYEVNEGGSIKLIGTGSTDDGDISSYSWSIVSGPGSLSNTDGNPDTRTYDAPNSIVSDKTVEVSLKVTDDEGKVDTQTVVFTVQTDDEDADNLERVDGNRRNDFDGTGSLSFEVTNSGGGAVTVDGMGVTLPNNDTYDAIEENGQFAEFELYGSDFGDWDTGGAYDLTLGGDGIVTLDDNAGVDAGDNLQIRIRNFRSGGTRKSVAGELVEVTLRFTDGSTKSFFVPGTFDSFEDNDLSEYTGSTGAFSIKRGYETDGSDGLKGDPSGTSLESISSTSGLAAYPHIGDQFNYSFQVGSLGNTGNSTPYRNRFAFGETDDGGHYSVTIERSSGSTYTLTVTNGQSTDSMSVTLNQDTWYEVTVDWDYYSVTVILIDANGNKKAVSVDSVGDNGNYVEFGTQDGITFFDYLRVVR